MIDFTATTAEALRTAAEEKTAAHERAITEGGYEHPYEDAAEVLDTDMEVQTHERTADDLRAGAALIDLHLAGVVDLAAQPALAKVIEKSEWALQAA